MQLDQRSSLFLRCLCACVLCRSVLSDSLQPNGLQPTRAVHGISQARISEWVVISFSRESCQPRDGMRVTCISCIAGGLFTIEPLGKALSFKGFCCLVAKSYLTLCNPVDHQALLSTGFPRQEYWSGLPFPSPEDHPDSEIEPASPALAGRFFTTEPLGKPSI